MEILYFPGQLLQLLLGLSFSLSPSLLLLPTYRHVCVRVPSVCPVPEPEREGVLRPSHRGFNFLQIRTCVGGDLQFTSSISDERGTL